MARILVIDDDPDVRATVARMLQSAGHEVALATNGKEGVDQYRACPTDLVISDIYMPGQEGLETIIGLRRCYPEIKIIAMSGKPAASTMLSIAERLGAVAVLQKPFSLQELLQAVKGALGTVERTTRGTLSRKP